VRLVSVDARRASVTGTNGSETRLKRVYRGAGVCRKTAR